MRYYLKDPPILYSEEFIVTYWGINREGFKEQKDFSVFFASKNRHKQASRVSCRINNHKLSDIVRVCYQ